MSKAQHSDNVHRTTLERSFIQATRNCHVCARYVLHTLLTLRNKGTKVMQAAGFIVVKISRILEKLLAFGLRVSGGVTDK